MYVWREMGRKKAGSVAFQRLLREHPYSSPSAKDRKNFHVYYFMSSDLTRENFIYLTSYCSVVLFVRSARCTGVVLPLNEFVRLGLIPRVGRAIDTLLNADQEGGKT